MSWNITDENGLDKKIKTEDFIGCEDDQREAFLLRKQRAAYKEAIEKKEKEHLKSWQKPAE